jgi:hypothetical protein
VARQALGWRTGIRVPDDVLPAAAMLQAVRDARPRRVTPLQEALSNSGELTYHRLPAAPDDEES